MLYACVRDVMVVVFYVCIVTRGAVGASILYRKCERFVMQMLYGCGFCASCGRSQCCILHDLKFVDVGRGCKRHTLELVSCLPCR